MYLIGMAPILCFIWSSAYRQRRLPGRAQRFESWSLASKEVRQLGFQALRGVAKGSKYLNMKIHAPSQAYGSRYIYIHIHIMNIYTHVNKQINTHVYIYTHIRNIYIYIYIYIYLFIYTHIHVHIICRPYIPHTWALSTPRVQVGSRCGLELQEFLSKTVR